jgi:hypothetical protein
MKQGDVTTQDEASVLPSPKVVQFSRDMTTATGTQSVTGVGFRPSAVIGHNVVDPSNKQGWGMDDATLSAGTNTRDAVGADTWEASNFIHVQFGGGVTYDGTIQSFDADGFTVSWTKAGASTGSLLCRMLCFK